MNLSDNLSLAEATRSATALRKGIANKPTQQHLLNLKEVALHIFQPCREHFGKPLRVTSGYRSEELNKAIGGSSKSQHSKGEALDMQSTKGYTNKELFMFIKDHLNFDQLIGEFPDNVGEYAWVHCSYKKEGNRGEVLIAYKDDNNKTKYTKW
jgi:zinc D-Ala-D-Ala carboxypeptidase